MSIGERPTTAPSRLPGLLALVAGLFGVVALVFAVLLFVGRSGGESLPVASSTSVVDPTSTSFGSPADGWTAITDDSGTIQVEVPSHWDDVATGGWMRDGEEVGPALSASVDRQAWLAGWETPGVFIGVTGTMAPSEALGEYQGDCVKGRSEPYELAGLAGFAEWWSDCGPVGSDFFVAAVAPDDDAFVLLVQVITVGPSGSAELDRVLQSLRYD